MQKKRIIRSLINIGEYNTFVGEILNLSQRKPSSYVCVANVHMLIEAYNDDGFNKIVNEADIATPDGMPLAKGINILYGIKQERVAGMDLMPDLMRECHRLDKKIYLYGSTEEVLNKIQKKAGDDFPGLKIESYSPPFRKLSAKEDEGITETINTFDPDFVFVALGCPKQERWMHEHKNRVNSCMIGLGGAFEVYAEIKNRAPQWMQHYSLEWVYRFAQDPKRLWKRYLVTNTRFILLFFVQLLQMRLFRKK